VDAFSARFASALHDLLERLIAEKSASLAITPAADYPAYRERVGIIKGLKDALMGASELETTLGRSEKTQQVATNSLRQGYET
jgi:hypothetical protein